VWYKAPCPEPKSPRAWRDRLLVTGLGPVGLAAAMLGRALGADEVIGGDTSPGRLELAQRLGLVDHALKSDAEGLSRTRWNRRPKPTG
jgi:threonine dehydrogenase-like Zn-dependent dehydrogenase